MINLLQVESAGDEESLEGETIPAKDGDLQGHQETRG